MPNQEKILAKIKDDLARFRQEAVHYILIAIAEEGEMHMGGGLDRNSAPLMLAALMDAMDHCRRLINTGTHDQTTIHRNPPDHEMN